MPFYSPSGQKTPLFLLLLLLLFFIWVFTPFSAVHTTSYLPSPNRWAVHSSATVYCSPPQKIQCHCLFGFLVSSNHQEQNGIPRRFPGSVIPWLSWLNDAVHVSGGVTGSSCQRFHSWPNGGGTFHESASIDPTACLETGAIVHEKAVLGANVCVGSGTVIGPSVAVGKSSWIGYNVSLSNCTIGVRDSQWSMRQSGGIGFFVDDCGQVFKKPQTLNSRIGNNVEIGANTCTDRGSWRDTVIGDCTKIDNLVQIGHNVIIGKNCLLCGQVGIAGSASLGDYVVLGGRAAVKDHVTITSKVRLAANSCVIKDIKDPGDYSGFPAVPIVRWRRQVATGGA